LANSHELALVGGLEVGGTKLVAAVGRGPGAAMIGRAMWPTGADPVATMSRAVDWLRQQEAAHGRLAAVGVATFGPVDLDTGSPTYGYVTTTPKPGWAHADLLGPLRQGLRGVPLGFDTDVNGAALGEHVWGAARGLSDFIYVTLGTGIGGGGMARGHLLHGLVHPEMGHLRLPRVAGDTFGGVCPYHGDCWEGLCSGPAMAARTGQPAESLPADHAAWRLVTHYIGRALANLVCVLSPRRIIVGGSVRKAGQLGEEEFFRQVRQGVQESLAAYVASPALEGSAIDEYIVAPALGDDAGVCGAMALAHRALG
jgi:fructokinase